MRKPNVPRPRAAARPLSLSRALPRLMAPLAAPRPSRVRHPRVGRGTPSIAGRLSRGVAEAWQPHDLCRACAHEARAHKPGGTCRAVDCRCAAFVE